MAALSLPIQILEHQVRLRAVEIRQEVEKPKGSGLLSKLQILVRIVRINSGFLALIRKEEKLALLVQHPSLHALSAEQYQKCAEALEGVVSDVTSMLDHAADMPEWVLRFWRKNMEKLVEQTGHLESIAESFRVAANPACTEALARAARELVVS
jgi:hypothetical protein